MITTCLLDSELNKVCDVSAACSEYAVFQVLLLTVHRLLPPHTPGFEAIISPPIRRRRARHFQSRDQESTNENLGKFSPLQFFLLRAAVHTASEWNRKCNEI